MLAKSLINKPSPESISPYPRSVQNAGRSVKKPNSYQLQRAVSSVVSIIASCHKTVDGFWCRRSKCFPPWRSQIDGTILPVFSEAFAIHGPSEKLVVLIERSELIWSWHGRPEEPGGEVDFPRSRGSSFRPTPDPR